MNIVYKGIEFPFRIKDSIKQRRIKLIKDTYKFYSENPDKVSVDRNIVVNGTCYYKSPDGNKCAIGRFIPDDEYSNNFEGKIATTIFDDLNINLKKLGSHFLYDLQNLHDLGFGRIDSLNEDYQKLLNFYK